MWGLLFSPGSVWRVAGGSSANDPLTPEAPILTLTSAAGEASPTFNNDLDGLMLWGVGEIDASNFDQIETEASKFSNFSVIEDEQTYTITELDLGDENFDSALWPLASGLTYYRSRHNHHVSGVDHWSAWSDTITDTVDSGYVPTFHFLGF